MMRSAGWEYPPTLFQSVANLRDSKAARGWICRQGRLVRLLPIMDDVELFGDVGYRDPVPPPHRPPSCLLVPLFSLDHDIRDKQRSDGVQHAGKNTATKGRTGQNQQTEHETAQLTSVCSHCRCRKRSSIKRLAGWGVRSALAALYIQYWAQALHTCATTP
ncbi:hypothetical protein BGX38DRAFT_801288 [Terfezia claveryi]|nr:hypothetical protein BGX38DRAFT_801288 [Terfezia claveryi]